ncbi:TetR family transcriptional regulator [Chitinophaga niastensis]|uniref:TetR family transcriptional regulator n=1 Tax=Chitinophaga niastensis TaxID=536980 RepID=A0A2P8HJ12_CHINA|nr:TetR/AcrR family transcriptional regulator [Chitinophaga niastensis]PSL46214.1 TetR family transcriptional regulator [Chitinophaga niastensis]
MGITERKERERAEMRRRIVDVAIKMFVEDGYEKVSIRNIADKIEYSPATIYLYYKDKDELLYDVQHEAFATLSEEFAKHINHKEPFKRLEQLAFAYVQFARDHPELYDLMFIIKAPMNVEHDEEKWKNGDPAYDALYNLVSECIEKKLIRFKDPTVATLSVWAFAHGFISLDLRCRFKVAGLTGEEINKVVDQSIKEYLHIIKV